jgi:hypothetical protein
MTRKLTLLAVVFMALLLIPSGGANAITVSPVLFDFEIATGVNRQDKVLLINDTGERETFSLLVENFVASGEEGAQEYIREEEPTDLASWVFVDQPTVTLDPGEMAEFPFIVSVPEDAEPGGHYATIFFSRGGREGSASGVGVTEQVGVLLLVRVPGDIREQANVESFRVVNGPVLNRLPAEFELRIRNTGSVHIRPKGTLVVHNLLGSVVARLPANPKKSAILPNSIRKIDSGWVKTVDIPKGGFWTEVKNEWRNFAIGRYTASIDVKYGSQSTQLPGQGVNFWVIPWRLLLLALGALIVLIALIKGYNALLVRAAMKKSRKKK